MTQLRNWHTKQWEEVEDEVLETAVGSIAPDGMFVLVTHKGIYEA